MDLPEVFILRHGQTEWNAQGRLHGHFDAPLSEIGRLQAAQQRDILARIGATGCDVFASPQPRALETARIALGGFDVPIIRDRGLLEIGIGAWAGRYVSDLPICLPGGEGEENLLPLYEAAPGGEGFAQLQTRCRGFLNKLRRPAVIVTHGITSRMLRVVLLGQKPEEIAAIDGGQGVVFQIKDGVQIKHAFGA